MSAFIEAGPDVLFNIKEPHLLGCLHAAVRHSANCQNPADSKGAVTHHQTASPVPIGMLVVVIYIVHSTSLHHLLFNIFSSSMSERSAASFVDRLPTEVSLEIVRYLADTHIPSLQNFSLVNSTFHHLATSFLFRDVGVRCSTSEMLQEDAEQLLKILVKYDCVLRVKTLFVEALDRRRRKALRYHWKQSDPSCGSLTMSEAEDLSIMHYERTFPIHDAMGDAAFWRSLTRLLRHLTALSDIIFDVFAQFPSDTLEALHQVNPSCRLHILRFRLQSLDQESPEHNDLKLMTSPCLHSVMVYVVEPRSDSTYDYNWDAAFEMIDGAASRLQHARIVDQYARGRGRGGILPRLLRHSPPERRRFSVRPADKSRRGSIRSFGYNGPLNDIIPELMQNSGLRDLEALEIQPWRVVDDETLRVLESIPSLPSLGRLRVRCSPSTAEEDGAPRSLLGKSARLKFLECLSSQGSLNYIEPTLKTCGTTLRELNVRHKEKLDTAMIEMLCEQLPQLQSICFNMERTMSLPPETDIYTALAKFAMLKSVTLIMKYNRDIRAPLRMWDHGRRLQDKLNERGRETARLLSNMAIDAELVRQIWLEITRDRTPHTGFTLKLSYDNPPYHREQALCFTR
jgi:hypothetical protein